MNTGEQFFLAKAVLVKLKQCSCNQFFFIHFQENIVRLNNAFHCEPHSIPLPALCGAKKEVVLYRHKVKPKFPALQLLHQG